MSESYSIFADYFQVYLQDVDHWEDFSGDWSDPRVYEELFIVKKYGVAFVTARNLEVPVKVCLGNEPYNINEWHHIVECSFELPSGVFMLCGPTSDIKESPKFNLGVGSCRVRILFSGLDRISEDGLEGEDKYEIHIWSAPYTNPSVIKNGSHLMQNF